MVARMKKFTFLAYHKDYELFLDKLRELGLIHVAETDRTAEETDELKDNVAQLKSLINAGKILQKQIDKKESVVYRQANIELGTSIPQKIEQVQNERSALLQQLQITVKERETLLPWGDFDPENIRLLEKEGYHLDFFVVSENQYNHEWEQFYDAIVVNKATSKVFFITVTKRDKLAEELGLESVKLPDVSLRQLDALAESLKIKIDNQNKELKELALDLPSVEAAIADSEQKITFTKVKQSSQSLADDKLMLLQGWAPEDNEKEITDYLSSKEVYFAVSDPQPDDNVPIKFKNNKFARLFEPIAEMYMLPKYNEIDLTPYFAPFYMLFFGLALGDIGYGLFLLLVASLGKISMKAKPGKSMVAILSLVQILGASTMIAGLLTGGFFGFNLYDIDIPFFQDLKNKVYFDNNKMFVLSLVLGVVQILFGMILKIANRIKQLGFKYALSTIGWLILLLSFIISALASETMPMFGTLHLVFLIPALVLIFFFNSPGKNPFLNFGTGLWDAYNMATGLLGDILSYVRLFALGLSGGILAGVFNSLADGMSPDMLVVKQIVFVLIFLIGHAINIFMNVLGAIVHPVRLTFVEFYKNAEFEGGGKKYTPFKK